MNRPTCVFLGALILASCAGDATRIDRIHEDGVEVVLNHVKPYRVPDESSILDLAKEFVIDAEDPELLSAGLSDILQFAVDSQGCVYLAQHPRKDENLFFMFDQSGRLIKSFGRVGQGPGEILGATYFGINSKDEVIVVDARTRKLLIFTSTGDLSKETLFSSTFLGIIIPLESGNFLVPETQEKEGSGGTEVFFSLLDAGFKRIRTFCRLELPSFPKETERINAYIPNPTGTFTADRIYVGIPGRENYEVLVYDLEGTLLRKIRKDYRPVELTFEFQEEVLARAPRGNPMVDRVYFPDHKPAFQYFFADEAGRLFVTTSEKDPASGQNICDVFNASGVFITRAAVGYYDLLRLIWEGLSLDVVAKNERLYVLHEKDNGFKELVVYKAVWH